MVRLSKIAAITVLAGAAAAAHAEPFGYGINSDSQDPNIPEDHIANLYRIDLATGDATRIGPVEFIDVEGLAFNQQGQLLGVDDITKTLLHISTETGQGTPVGFEQYNLGLPVQPFLDFGMAISCDGRVFLSAENQRMLLEADMEENGAVEEIGGTNDTPITGMTSWGDRLLGLGSGDDPNLYEINPGTGDTTLIGALQNAAPYGDGGLAFDAQGQLWAITDRTAVDSGNHPSQILRIDPDTGEATPVAETISGVESLAIAPPGGCQPAGPGPNPEEVPTLSKFNLAAMALVLLLAGGLLARQRANR